MKVAFYKGTRPGLQGIYNRLVRLLDGSKYSHVELLFNDGISASSSYMDGGVRFKVIEFDSKKWDLFELKGYDSVKAKLFFAEHLGQPYDVMGNIKVIIPWWPHSKTKWHCTEIIAEALGLEASYSFGPKKLFEYLVK